MPVNIWIAEDFEYPHEREQAARLVDLMKQSFDNDPRHYHLCFNFFVDGASIDAALVKHDAILVIDLKSAGGRVHGGENGPWTINSDDGTLVQLKGGSTENPYTQVRKYRYAMIQFIKTHASQFLKKARLSVSMGSPYDHWVKSVVLLSPDLDAGQADTISIKQPWFSCRRIGLFPELVQTTVTPRLELQSKEMKKLVTNVFNLTEARLVGNAPTCIKETLGEADLLHLSIETESKLGVTQDQQQLPVVSGAVEIAHSSKLSPVAPTFVQSFAPEPIPRNSAPELPRALVTKKSDVPASVSAAVRGQLPSTFSPKDGIRFKNEAEYHVSSIKSAIQNGAELEFSAASVTCAERHAPSIPDTVRALADGQLHDGYLVVLDCSFYSKPIQDLKNEIDKFLPDLPSHMAHPYLIWFFGPKIIAPTQPEPPLPRTLHTQAMLPQWLDRFIYNEQKAPCQADHHKVQKNLQASPEDVLWYLGTYFPRSYGEMFCIADNLFEHMKRLDASLVGKELSILDVGCGSGGALIGLLWAARKYKSDLQRLHIVAIDGNRAALDTLDTVISNAKRVWDPGVLLCTHCETLADRFPTDMVTGKTFDIILTSKLLGELSVDGNDAYRRFLETYAKYLKKDGFLVMLDVPTKTDGTTQYNPNRMLNSANQFVRASSGVFKTLLPLSCACNGLTCQKGCFCKKTFTIQTSRNTQIESDVCYVIITRSILADKLLEPLDFAHNAFPCVPSLSDTSSTSDFPTRDPFCL